MSAASDPLASSSTSTRTRARVTVSRTTTSRIPPVYRLNAAPPSVILPGRHEASRREPVIVGQRIRRPDAADKVKGTALFIEDLHAGGMLVGGVLRSPHAHARIARLDVAAARRRPGVFAVLTAQDVPGKNLIPMIHPDWPVLAEGEVRHVGEGVALVAAESREALAEALAAIVVEYEPLPAVLDMEAALAAGDVITQWTIRRGAADVALSRAGVVVVEGT